MTWWAAPPWPSTATPPCAPGPGPGRGTSWWTSTRTPTPPRRPCCAAWPPRRRARTCASSPTPSRASTPSVAPPPSRYGASSTAWPGAAVVRLEQNYRSTKSIVAVARRLSPPGRAGAERRERRRRRLVGRSRPAPVDGEPGRGPGPAVGGPPPGAGGGGLARDVRALLEGTADGPAAAPDTTQPGCWRHPARSAIGGTASHRGPRRTSPSWSAPTPRPAPSRPPSCGPGCPTPSSAGCASSPARRSRTPWPTCAWPSCAKTPPLLAHRQHPPPWTGPRGARSPSPATPSVGAPHCKAAPSPEPGAGRRPKAPRTASTTSWPT